MHVKSYVIAILTCILLSVFAGCLATEPGVDYPAVAGDMTAASKNISRIDLTIMDATAIADMKSRVMNSQQHLDSALARIDAAPPARTSQEDIPRKNTRNVLLGFSEYNKVMLSMGDFLEHLLPLMNFDPDQISSARRTIAESDTYLDAMIVHLDSGSNYLESVDVTALPPEIRTATGELCQKYAGRDTIPETVERFEGVRSMDYLIRALDYLLAGVDYYQKSDYRMAEQKLLTARDYLIVIEAYGGTDFSSVKDMREDVDEILSKRIFGTVSGQAEEVYITDPHDSAKQILLHDAVVRAGY